jgi:ABC-type multidrug transport system fused ATPase/permease subunit
MSIPLLYYIFPFQNYFGDVFLSMLQSSPVFFSILYVLIFSATKQVGALVFGLAFWTASSLVHDERIRQSLLITSVGIVTLYGSINIASLQYHVFPPYGLVTEAFIPIGAYLLFVGIFISAKHISRDVQVRKEFYKSASSQLTLLQTIGVSQMEKELEGEVKSLEERFKPLERTDEPDLKDDDIKEILHDVLTELYYSKGRKEMQRS